MAAPPAKAPFRVRDLAGGWHEVDLVPGMTEAGVEDAVAAAVNLALGTFGLVNANGNGTVFHAGLVDEWYVVLQPRPMLPAYAPPGHAPPGHAPQGYAPQGFAPHGYGPQGFAPHGYAPQGFAPHGFAPHGYGPQGYAPQGYAPQGAAGGTMMYVDSLAAAVTALSAKYDALAATLNQFVARHEVLESVAIRRGLITRVPAGANSTAPPNSSSDRASADGRGRAGGNGDGGGSVGGGVGGGGGGEEGEKK
jgi:hypothetical protein